VDNQQKQLPLNKDEGSCYKNLKSRCETVSQIPEDVNHSC